MRKITKEREKMEIFAEPRIMTGDHPGIGFLHIQTNEAQINDIGKYILHLRENKENFAPQNTPDQYLDCITHFESRETDTYIIGIGLIQGIHTQGTMKTLAKNIQNRYPEVKIEYSVNVYPQSAQSVEDLIDPNLNEKHNLENIE